MKKILQPVHIHNTEVLANYISTSHSKHSFGMSRRYFLRIYPVEILKKQLAEFVPIMFFAELLCGNFFYWRLCETVYREFSFRQRDSLCAGQLSKRYGHQTKKNGKMLVDDKPQTNEPSGS